MSKANTHRPVVKVGFAKMWHGFDAEDFLKSFLRGVYEEFRFEVSDEPGFLIYGPYSGDLKPTKAKKIFFGCENVRPNMRECDWAFSYDHDDVVRHPRHMRAVFHSDERFIKRISSPSEVRRSKTKFCNFIYSNKVAFRESFCKKLSEYRKVDCPGKSLNNMPSFDENSSRPWWETKLEFLADYKFTIAFENSSSHGYNTEKIFQPMSVNSIPIYWGDPSIHTDYNPMSFCNYYDLQSKNRLRIPRLPTQFSERIVGKKLKRALSSLTYRVNNRLEQLNHSVWHAAGFDRLIKRIIEIDKNDSLYDQMMSEPWCYENKAPDQTVYWNRWREIFSCDSTVDGGKRNA